MNAATTNSGHSGDYRIWWDEKRGIARAWARSRVDVAAAEALRDETERIAREHGERIDWLLDMRDITTISARARRILAKAVAHPSIQRYATFGASIFIRTVSGFIASAAGLKNMKHFRTEAEALRWLER